MLLVSSRLVVDLTTPEPILEMLLVIEPVDEVACKIGFPGKSYDEVIYERLDFFSWIAAKFETIFVFDVWFVGWVVLPLLVFL